MEEITPITAEPEAFGREVEAAAFQFFRLGYADIKHDGRAERVAMVRSSSSPLGCGTQEAVREWPLVLNNKGLPDIESPVYKQGYEATFSIQSASDSHE
jgi:hypothetical protein